MPSEARYTVRHCDHAFGIWDREQNWWRIVPVFLSEEAAEKCAARLEREHENTAGCDQDGVGEAGAG